ncbi:semaphorin-2A-like [Babylonia areolata]|uniref:semaphorin-2A-like n=1 Tax=Babylonia areolata TaxID=304850 RepID=UPI003FD0194A
MCTTGAYQPIAYQLRLENRRFRILSEDSENGVGICPYDPSDNTTAILVERGNPGGLPALYAGGVTDFIKADPIIMRPDLYNLNNTLQVRYVRTLRDRNKWLNEPQFVGSFDLGDHVYFFFREVALEYTNCGKKIYSRVVRICKNDQGGQFILRSVWTSFVKARLNCSIPGEYPYYFDEIQDVFLIGETFYGLFTTNINGLTASAICAFTLSDLNKAFWGPFKGQESKNSNWLPIPEVEVPNPRPGNCTKQLSMQAVNFISRSELLMDKAVSQQFGRPLFYQGNCLLQKLSVRADVSGQGDLVFFAASNTGVVYKIFAWPSRSSSDPPRSYVSTTYLPFDDGRPIWTMLLRGQTLFLGTDQSVVQINVETCHVYLNVDLCLYDPYCGWDAKTNECVKAIGNRRVITFADIDLFSHDLEQAIQLKVGDLYKYEKVSKISGSSVTLKVEYKLHVPGTVTWTRNNTVVSDERHILAQDNSLIITDLRKSDEGVYVALDRKKRTVAKYLLSIETTKEQIEQRWMKKFDQWCDEFERYQNDIRQWEQKCNACCEESPLSNMVPGIDGK